jgi:DnaA family protein
MAAAAELHSQGARLGWLDAEVHSERLFNESWSAILLDDVHRYTAAQQQQAFNWLINAQTHQCAVLVAGDTAPVALPLRDDLRTRLGWGHVFGLQPLDEPAQRAVLRQSAQARGLTLSDEVLDYMLNRFSRDMGNLMELLQRMDRYALQTQRAITIPLIKSMMDNA